MSTARPSDNLALVDTAEGITVVTVGRMKIAGPYANRYEAEAFLERFDESCAQLVRPAPRFIGAPRSHQIDGSAA